MPDGDTVQVFAPSHRFRPEVMSGIMLGTAIAASGTATTDIHIFFQDTHCRDAISLIIVRKHEDILIL